MTPARSSWSTRVEFGVLLTISMLALLQLAACDANDAGAGDRNLIAETQLTWSTLDDGSSFAQTSGDASGSATAFRCWASREKGFDCLRATKYNGASMPMTAVIKEHRDDLPDMSLPMPFAGEGYSCRSLLDVTEEVEGTGGTLISNRPVDLGDIWSRHHVDSYMAANHVSGVKWFPCVRVLNAILKGSLATLGTTSVSKADLRGG